MKLLVIILGMLLVFLQYQLWSNKDGLFATYRLHKMVAGQTAKNIILKKQNKALESVIRDLRVGNAAVEEAARNELGLIKPGETFYRTIKLRKNCS